MQLAERMARLGTESAFEVLARAKQLELAGRDVMSLLLEGGSGVLTSAFEAGIISKLFLAYAPLLIGGSAALSLWGGEGIGELAAAPRLRHVRHFDLGDDWAVEGYLQAPEPPI